MSKLFPAGEYPARFTVATSFGQRARYPSALNIQLLDQF